MKDIPTPEHDALFRGSNDRSLGDELCMVYVLAHSLEQRLVIAVAALKEIADYQCIKPPDETAKEALAQIEDETLGGFRGELLLRCCIEICQEESTDNGTAQKIEARIRALKRDVRAISNVTFKRSE